MNVISTILSTSSPEQEKSRLLLLEEMAFSPIFRMFLIFRLLKTMLFVYVNGLMVCLQIFGLVLLTILLNLFNSLTIPTIDLKQKNSVYWSLRIRQSTLYLKIQERLNLIKEKINQVWKLHVDRQLKYLRLSAPKGANPCGDLMRTR